MFNIVAFFARSTKKRASSATAATILNTSLSDAFLGKMEIENYLGSR